MRWGGVGEDNILALVNVIGGGIGEDNTHTSQCDRGRDRGG